MAGITLAQAEAKLSEYLAAETKILKLQRSSVNGKEIYRADLESVQAGIEIWQKRVNQLSRTGGMRARQVVPE